MSSSTLLFEACVDSVASAFAALSGGAGRVELCESLTEGGLTPSLGKIEGVVRVFHPRPVHVLIRPRPGDFCYSEEEFALMLREVHWAKVGGAQGVVVGVLQPDGTLDEPRMAALVECARGHGLAVTLHRAVDASRDVVEAALAGGRVGVDFILTSGGALGAREGAASIARMRVALEGLALATGTPPPILIAAGGVSPLNAWDIAQTAGVSQLHGTARPPYPRPGAMTFFKDPPVYMGGEKTNSPMAEYGIREATAESIAAVVKALKEGGAQNLVP